MQSISPALSQHLIYDKTTFLAIDTLSVPTMSVTKEKHTVFDDLEKVQTYNQLGDVIVIGEPLTVEEDRRILRKIDVKCVWPVPNTTL